MSEDAKANLKRRLSRIEGQVRGITRMVEDGRYCLDVVTQISAARAALKRVEESLVRSHVEICIDEAITRADAPDQRRKVGELVEVLMKTSR